jgi:hypothetical protein
MQQVEIRVKGRIDKQWSDWFSGLTISHTDGDETILAGSIADQAALYGLIARLRDLGLPLVSVETNPQSAENSNQTRKEASQAAGIMDTSEELL